MTLARKLLGLLLQFAAGFVIVLALLVGVVRLVLPEASTLTDEIKTAVKDSTGFSIEFRFISAGVSWYGPELRFSGVTLNWPDGEQIIAADRFVLSASVLAALSERKLVPSRVLVAGSAIEAEVSGEGDIFLQGRPWRELLGEEERSNPDAIPEMRLQLEDIDFTFRDLRRDAPPVDGYMRDFEADLDDAMVEISADMEPGEELGRQLSIEAEVPLRLLISGSDVDADTAWNLAVVLGDFRLDPWLRLLNLPDLPVIGSEGSVEAGVKFRGPTAIEVQMEADLQNVQLTQPEGPPMVVDWVEGEFNWQAASGGWLASGAGIRIGRGSRIWPETNFTFRYVTRPDSGRSRYLVRTNFLRIDDLLPVVRAITPGKLEEAGLAGTAQGDLTDVSAELVLLDAQLDDFSIETGFASLGYVSPEQGLELTGYSGELEADSDGGDLSLRTRGAQFGLRDIFPETLDIASIQGVAVWRANEDGYRVLANSIELETPHGGASASLELVTDAEFEKPEVDISGVAWLEDIANAPSYVPTVLPPHVLNWLESALISGRVPNASFRLRGPLKSFPFRGGEGDFLMQINVVDAVLDFAPDWPIINNIGGEIVFENASLYSFRNTLNISGMELQAVNVRIDDLREGLLTARGEGDVNIVDVVAFLRDSPVRDVLGPVLDDVQTDGLVEASIDLALPIKDMEAWQLKGEFETRDARFGLLGVEPEFTELAGTGSIHNTKITIPAATAKLLGEQVSIAVRPAGTTEFGFSHRADVSGPMQMKALWAALDLPGSEFFDGRIAFDAIGLFPLFDDDIPEEDLLPFRLLFESDMVGATSAVPYPLLKQAEEVDGLQAELRFPEAGRIDFYGSLQRGFDWTVRMHQVDGWAIDRGLVSRSGGLLELPDEPGVRVEGYVDSLVVDDWINAFSDYEPADPERAADLDDWEQTFSQIELQIGEMDAADYRFVDVDLRARPMESAWDINISSPWLEGAMTVPFEITGPDHMILSMQRVLLIEPLEVGEPGEPTDPRELPTVRGRVEQFALNAQQFGALDVEVDRTPDGLKTVLMRTTAGSFTTEGSAGWEVVDNAQRTRLHVELSSTDMKQTLSDLDYDPLLSAKEGLIVTDLLWEGPPGMAMIYESTGTVEMMIRDGVVFDVDPGGGRVLGLLSVAALPRRLTLDFSDMTADGLPFDKLSGTFRIDFGNAFTCDVGLEGDITDMGVVGRTGMRTEDYDQIAAIRPHVSNLAPVAGAFLAGPAVGVAALLITQIFKKPLSGVGGSYYTITGSWDDPLIEPVERSDLDLTAFSECEEQLPELSPEEIGAMEDLLKSREPRIELPEGMFDTGKSPPQEDEADSPETKDVDELYSD